jgi:IS5 family transposase
VVDFEIFRADLDAALARSDRSRGGRPPMDVVMMFKVLVLQALYGLDDEQTELQIRDRLSFMRFLSLDLHGRVPDARTIWLFRELLTKARAIDVLFARFDTHLRDRGYLAMGRQMIDASIVAAPRQRNTDAEKADLKAGRIPDDWTANPAKLRQKDRDERWTLKRGRRKRKPNGTLMMEIATPVYGYKSHIGVDRRHRFIRTWSVTDAARYDGRELPVLLNRSNTGSSGTVRNSVCGRA